MNAGFTEFLLGALAVLLVVAAAIDARTYTISNRLTLAVALLAPVYWWSAGLTFWPVIASHIAAAGGIFVLLALAFYAGMMGGGDVKLAAALALWLSPVGSLHFLLFMSVAGGFLTLIIVAAHRLRSKEGRPEIPYGIAIAIGGLVILAQRFLNQFA